LCDVLSYEEPTTDEETGTIQATMGALHVEISDLQVAVPMIPSPLQDAFPVNETETFYCDFSE
jgi:hypothetical protein